MFTSAYEAIQDVQKHPDLSKREKFLLSETEKVLNGRADFIAKIAAICLLMDNLPHEKTSASRDLLYHFNGHNTLRVSKKHHGRLGRTNWHAHLQRHWYLIIQKAITDNLKETNIRKLSQERQWALTSRSYQGLSVGEFHCVTAVRGGKYATFHIGEHQFECG